MPPDFYYGKIKMTLTATQKLFAKPLTAALTALLLACAAPAWADDHAQFQQGYTAYQAGNYAQALRLWQPLAQKGNAEAQFALGLMYDKGQGVAQTDRQAAAWYQKAADQGDAAAQFNLGLMYDNGQGVAQNDRQAAAWYQKAANQGHAKAQYNLGVMYYNGQGMARNYRQAAAWYKKVLAQPDTPENAEAKALARENLQGLSKRGVR